MEQVSGGYDKENEREQKALITKYRHVIERTMNMIKNLEKFNEH